MKADENWDAEYDQFMAFLQEHKCRPSKYRVEEHQMLNWYKYNKKRLSRGCMSEKRKERFLRLMEMAKDVQRVNQYAPVHNFDRQLKLEL